MSSSQQHSPATPPRRVEVVQVRLCGHPRAVTALARRLAQVVTVSQISHHASAGPTIELEITCLQPVKPCRAPERAGMSLVDTVTAGGWS